MGILNYRKCWPYLLATLIAVLTLPMPAHAGSEASLKLPDLHTVSFFVGSITGSALLTSGLVICVGGLLFGCILYGQLKKLPVHRAMLDVSELIYATCKTYLLTQIKFILLLELFIGTIIVIYFKFLAPFEDPVTHLFRPGYPWGSVAIIVLFSLIGIAGSASVAAGIYDGRACAR